MAHIEECLGDSWPKTLYPHGAGREWSTSTHNDVWKESMGFEVVPAEHLTVALDALREIADRTDVPADFANAAVRLQWASSRAANAVATLPSPRTDQTNTEADHA